MVSQVHGPELGGSAGGGAAPTRTWECLASVRGTAAGRPMTWLCEAASGEDVVISGGWIQISEGTGTS